jgi:hypothetical protein
MGSSVDRIFSHAGPTHGRSGASVAWLGSRLVIGLLLGLAAAGCGGDQGNADELTSQASTAPGVGAASESSVASGQAPGSGSGEASGPGTGSGSPSTDSNHRSGSGSSGISGQRSGGAPGSPGGDAD